MLLQIPWSVVEEFDDGDVARELAIAMFLPPSRLKLVTAGQRRSPRLAEEICDKDDESTGNNNLGRFELAKVSVCWAREISWWLQGTHVVDLAHDSLETRENGREEETSKGQSGLEIITERQKMLGSIGTGDDDHILAAVVLLVVLFMVPFVGRCGSRLDFTVACIFFVLCAESDFLVDGRMGGSRDNLALDRVERPDDD